MFNARENVEVITFVCVDDYFVSQQKKKENVFMNKWSCIKLNRCRSNQLGQDT